MPPGDPAFDARVDDIMKKMEKPSANNGMGSIFDMLGTANLLAPPKPPENKTTSKMDSIAASAFGDLFGGGSLFASYDSALTSSATSSTTSSTPASTSNSALGTDNPFGNLFGGNSLFADMQSILNTQASTSALVKEEKRAPAAKDPNAFSASSIFGSSSIFGDLLNPGAASTPPTKTSSETAKDISTRADKLVDQYKSTVATESAKETGDSSNPFGSLLAGASIFAGTSLFAASSLLSDEPFKSSDQKKSEFTDRIQDVLGDTHKAGAAFLTKNSELGSGTKSKDEASQSLSALLGSTSGLLTSAFTPIKEKTAEEKKKEFDERMKALGFGKIEAPKQEEEEEDKQPTEAERKKALAEKMKKMMGGMDFSIKVGGQSFTTESDDTKDLAGGGDKALALVDKYSMSEADRKKQDEERLVRIMKEQLAAEGIELPEDQVRKMALGEVESPEEAKKRKDARLKELTDATLRAQGIDPNQKFDTATTAPAYKDRVKELMREKLKAKGLDMDENIQVEDDSFSARVAEIAKANMKAQGLEYIEGDLSLDDPNEKTPEEREREMKERVQQIMREKLKAKGIDPDAMGTAELSEEEQKKAFDARVKEIMRKKLAEKGINIDDTSLADDSEELSPEERKKKYQERVKRIMAEKLAAKGIKVDADGNILDDDLEDKSGFDAKVKSIMAAKLAAKGVKIGADGEPEYDLTEEEKKKLFDRRVEELMKSRLTKLGNVTGLEAALALLDKDIEGDNLSKKEREERRREAIQAKMAEMYEQQKAAELNRENEANEKEDKEWEATLQGLSPEEREEAIKKREHELMVKFLVMDMMEMGKKRKKRNKQQLQEEIYEQVEKRLPKVDCEYEVNSFMKGKCNKCKISVYRHTKGNIPVEQPKRSGPVPVCSEYKKPDNVFMTKCQECGHPEKKHAAPKRGKKGKGDAAAKKFACSSYVENSNAFKQGQCQTCGFKESAHEAEEEEGDDYSYGDILAHCCGAASVQFSIEFMLEPFFQPSDSDSGSSSGSSSDEESEDDK